MALLQTLQDSFPGTSLNPQWISNGLVTVAGNRVSLDCASGAYINSAGSYEIAGSYAFCRFAPAQGAGYDEALVVDGDINETNGYQFGYATGSTLNAQWVNGGSYTDLGSIPYDPVAHAWLRIREDAGATTVFYETSPDAVNWAVQFTHAPVSGLTEVFAQVYANGPSGTAFVSSFGIAPAAAAAPLLSFFPVLA